MSTQTAQLPPHAEVLNILMGRWLANAVSCVAELGIPDVLEAGPKSPAEVAAQIGADANCVYRLMRATAGIGVFNEGADGKFSQTPLSDLLRTNAQPSLRYFAMMTRQEWHSRAWEKLPYCVKTGKQALDAVYGIPLFEYLQNTPEQAAIFNNAMTALSTIESPAVVDAYDFSGFGSIMDVGGGHGLLLATILARNPKLKGTLYEQPRVIEGAVTGPLVPVMDRVTLTSGNMFESVPAGADAYIMKYIIHDWPDDLCLKILKSCRAGVNAGGKLLVADQVIPPGNDYTFGKIVDLEMMLLPGGHERTEQQFRDLFAAAGWRLTRIIPTAAPMSIVEGVAA
jgi:hypothetical protein